MTDVSAVVCLTTTNDRSMGVSTVKGHYVSVATLGRFCVLTVLVTVKTLLKEKEGFIGRSVKVVHVSFFNEDGDENKAPNGNASDSIYDKGRTT